ncbi:unnamed protein product, partial [Lymnaea stagnalis]
DLLTSYTFDFEKALEERLENVKKYSYPFDLNQVDKRNNLPLQEFLDIYDGKWPVIINDIVHNWQAFNWTKDFFVQQYRNANIIMSSSVSNIFNKSSFVVPMGSFLEQIDVGKENSWLYLQDELFLLQYPELRKQIEDSVYTNENYFNLFPEEVRPWDCYFLWGTAHSRSSLHIDPYNWTGTNAVLTGHKRWKLILPGQDKYLSVYPDKICGFPLDCRKYNSPIDLFADDKETELLLNEIQHLEVDQLPGEMLFIPTGWFHQAFNVEPTLAISGQLMNENNFMSVLEEILKAGSLQRSDIAEDLDGLTDDPKALV